MKHNEAVQQVFAQATPADIRDGSIWYLHARRLVDELATAYSTSREIVAGVLAACSQRTQWSTNIDRATSVLDGKTKVGGLPAAVRKAVRIRKGEDPEQVLGKEAFKIKEFYRALLGDDDAAVIDVWMIRAMGWHRPSYTGPQYRRLADVLRAEAKRVGLKTTEYQATVWCVIRGRAD